MLDGKALLTILAALKACSAQIFDVYQSPNVSASEHSTVTLFCNYTFAGKSNGFYKWYRHDIRGPEVTNTSKEFSGRVSLVDPSDFTIHKSANIQIHRLNLSDSGLYFCAVTLITRHQEATYGNGTYLDVKHFVADSSKLHHVIAASCSTIAVIAILVVAAVVVFLKWSEWSKKLPDCLLLRMMEDTKVHTYCTVEELRTHTDEQLFPQKRYNSEGQVYIKDNWQYAL